MTSPFAALESLKAGAATAPGTRDCCPAISHSGFSGRSPAYSVFNAVEHFVHLLLAADLRKTLASAGALLA